MFYYIFKDLRSDLVSIAEKIKNNHEETVERLNSFLTKIFQIQIYKEHIIGFMETEESKKKVYFNAAQLKDMLTPDYNKLIDELVTHNLIQLEKSYCGYGCNYKLFKLTDKSLNSLRSDATLQFDRVKNGLRKYYNSKFNKLEGLNKQVFDMIWKFKIQITTDQLKIELKNKYPKYVAEKAEYIKSFATKKELKKGITIMQEEEYINQYKFYSAYINLWNNSTKTEKKAFVSVDSYGYRMHSIFTTLPSFIRRYIKADGKNILVCLDLKQSQPTLLSKLVYESYGDNTFSDAVWDRDIYTLYPSYERQNAKKQFLRSIFSNRFTVQYKELSRLFPILGQFILETQNLALYRDGKILDKYKNTSCLLQRMESKIFRKIWKKLLAEKIKFLNVHDAIYVDIENKDKVHDIMKHILMRELNPIKCEIDVETLADPLSL